MEKKNNKAICPRCNGEKFSPMYSYKPVEYKGEMWVLAEVRCLGCDYMLEYLFQLSYDKTRRIFNFNKEDIKRWEGEN